MVSFQGIRYRNQLKLGFQLYKEEWTNKPVASHAAPLASFIKAIYKNLKATTDQASMDSQRISSVTLFLHLTAIIAGQTG